MSGWVNYDDVIGQLQGAGLILDKEIRPDNRWQTWRVEGEDKERRGRSILKEWNAPGGDSFIVGVFGVWHGNAFDQITVELPKLGRCREVTEEERRAMAAARKAMLAEAEKAQKAQAKQCAQWAGIVWAACRPAQADHPYLSNKGIAPHIARQLSPDMVEGLNLPGLDEANTARLNRAINEFSLVIPMHDDRAQVQGLQFISQGKTFWPTGMAMGSTFGLIGPLPRAGVMLLTEGYATAATLREATGYPVAYAFSAINLGKAAKVIRKASPSTRILICADDDYLTDGNPGCTAAAMAAGAVPDTAWIKPDFTDDAGQDRRAGKKITDFNDLAALLGGLTLPLAQQIHAKLDALGWREARAGASAAGDLPRGDGGDARALMPSVMSVDEAAARYWNTYGLGGQVLFDEVDRRLVHVRDVQNLLPPRSWDLLKFHPNWRTARDTEIGFDPTERDPEIRCNLYGGWPTQPRAGVCDALLDLLRYMCSNEANDEAAFDFVIRWLAYPIQHPGAKMHSAIIVHGPQGTGKSRFFEAYGKIFGPYFRVLGQEALEDKFNADWAEKKLFILADEVLARQDMYHIKNRLKGFITGDSIRVNPKNVAAHTEKNHMNIVFLSNERMPLVMEDDDRRHMVLWVPPKLPQSYFEQVNEEIDKGGIEALHHYLLNLNLGDFKPWSNPPMTKAKRDLQRLGKNSEERFLEEWLNFEIDGSLGDPLPVCPALGSHLYHVYGLWCERHGERKRGAKDLISLCGKQHGWRAGDSCATWDTFQDRTIKKRKMIIPGPATLAEAAKRAGEHQGRRAPLVIPQKDGQTMAEWLTDCYFTFGQAAGLIE